MSYQMLMQKMTIETQEINGITSVEIKGFADAIMRYRYYDDQIPKTHKERVESARYYKRYERYVEGALGYCPLFEKMLNHPKPIIRHNGRGEYESFEVLDCLSALGHLIDIDDNGTGHIKLVDGDIAL